MNNVYKKKVDLSVEEINSLQKALLINGQKEEEAEAKLEELAEKFKADKKAAEYDISEAKALRIDSMKQLLMGYKYVEVTSKVFTDNESNIEIVIEEGKGELLEYHKKPSYPNPELDFFNIPTVNTPEELETYLRDQKPYYETLDIFKSVTNVIEIEKDQYYYFYSDDYDSRLIKSTSSIIELIKFTAERIETEDDSDTIKEESILRPIKFGR